MRRGADLSDDVDYSVDVELKRWYRKRTLHIGCSFRVPKMSGVLRSFVNVVSNSLLNLFP